MGNENHINLSNTSEKPKKNTEKTSININKRPTRGQNGENSENKHINALIGRGPGWQYLLPAVQSWKPLEFILNALPEPLVCE